MAKAYYDLNDANLLAWSAAFSQHLGTSAAEFHVTGEQTNAYAALNAAFASALSAWTDNATRTPVASERKQVARANLLDGARYLVSTINTNPLTTDAQRQELGINPRKRPTPRPAPASSPMIDVDSTSGRTVTFKLHAPGRKRGRAANAQGASVFTHVGDVAPADPAAYAFEGLITKTKFTVSFEQRTEADTVWVSAFWYNEKGQSGQACAPISVKLPAATAMPAGESKMKIAA